MRSQRLPAIAIAGLLVLGGLLIYGLPLFQGRPASGPPGTATEVLFATPGLG